jgi:hypothetical protein
MPSEDITYNNRFAESFYYDETEKEALRISRTDKVAKFPSANARYSRPKSKASTKVEGKNP